MIAIVDYRAGNLTSVLGALTHLGHDSVITSDPAVIRAADRIIFPGVGAAGTAMGNLTELGLANVLKEAVERGKPFLGICLGYQILFEVSEEDQRTRCLGLLPGQVIRFDDRQLDSGTQRPLKIPHMGWNRVDFTRKHPVWDGVPAGSEFYFVHSYYPVPEPGDVAMTAEYGIVFAAGVARGALVGMQFHPEKSGAPGLKLLDNFCRWDGTVC